MIHFYFCFLYFVDLYFIDLYFFFQSNILEQYLDFYSSILLKYDSLALFYHTVKNLKKKMQIKKCNILTF